MTEIQRDVDFASETAGGKVIADFWGTGCGNCKAMEPFLKQLETENKDIKFLKVNTEASTALTAKYEVTSLPTLIFFKDGNPVGRLTGLKPKTLISKKIIELF